MREVVTIDGYFAQQVNGEGLALALDRDTIGEETVDALTAPAAVNAEADQSEWQVLGRSALGIVTGIDVSHAGEPAVCEGDSLLVPIDMTAYGKLGRQLLPRLLELMSDHNQGQPLRWDGYRLPFGRLLHRGGLVQLDDDELDRALDQFLIASGDYPDRKGDVVIENNTLSLPLEPWKLIPDETLLGNPNALRPMIQEGASARAFAFDRMRPERLAGRSGFSEVLVGAVLFAPGPFFGQVVEAVSPEGVMPQIPSAAWLDAGRSLGLHAEQLPGHRGRQVEVLNTNPDIGHTWSDTRVSVKVFRPAEDSDQSQFKAWMDLSPEERQDKHYFGYGKGI